MDKKILIVDDDRTFLEAITEKISGGKFKLLTASDGEEGLQIASAEHPDLVILDLIMPRMDGITVLKNLRQDPWGKNASVIILTNVNDNEKLAEALEIGIDEYIVKSSTTLNDVAGKIKKIMGV